MRDCNYLLDVKHKVFSDGKLTDIVQDSFDDMGEAITAFEAHANSPLTLQARLVDTENGMLIRRYVR